MAKKVQKKPGNVPEGAPAGIFINAQYLKDLSFENPNPLEAYKNDEKPEIKVNINTLVKKLPDNAFEVTLDIKTERKVNKYVPLSTRSDRPEAVLWLTKNYPQLSDGQIVKLVGSTKNTVSSIRNKNYWNSSNLTPKDPVVFNFCSEIDIKKAIEKADRKIAREKKKLAKENKKKIVADESKD